MRTPSPSSGGPGRRSLAPQSLCRPTPPLRLPPQDFLGHRVGVGSADWKPQHGSPETRQPGALWLRILLASCRSTGGQGSCELHWPPLCQFFSYPPPHLCIQQPFTLIYVPRLGAEHDPGSVLEEPTSSGTEGSVGRQSRTGARYDEDGDKGSMQATEAAPNSGWGRMVREGFLGEVAPQLKPKGLAGGSKVRR